MSKIKTILATFEHEGGLAVDFVDDLNREYQFTFPKESAEMYATHVLEQEPNRELEEEFYWWNKEPLAWNLPVLVLQYVQASFMEWRELVEVEDSN